ncbi:NmrA-like family domain-containing protein 1 [Bienertia sinuspersici]
MKCSARFCLMKRTLQTLGAYFSRDLYFVKKLSNLVGDDGFEMNHVLVSLWYIMGLWPLVYSMLLIPSGRSSKGISPVWPFVTFSIFGGAYALLPYFIIWRPPPPSIKEGERESWPLNFLESKLTAGLLATVGLGLIVYAGLAPGDWKEFFQYFRESKFVHATCLDFTLLSAFAPFWVYNDMTSRKCYDKTSWLLPLSIVPFLGPALYLLLRPPLTTMPVSLESTLKSD